MPEYPRLFDNYLKFCVLKEGFVKTNKIDLSNESWLYPTTLLPLADFIFENKNIAYQPPASRDLKGYLEHVMDESHFERASDSYCPIVRLPKEGGESSRILRHLYRLQENGKYCGGENAFKYIVGELVSNIYEHSEFTNALVMAQGYQTKKFVEICFFDNGISIPGAFRKAGLTLKHFEAIAQAINGLSTKEGKERGFGLGSSLKIVSEGLQGQTLIVSGHGAIYTEKREQIAFELSNSHSLSGTLISIKIPFSTKVVNIYDYFKQ